MSSGEPVKRSGGGKKLLLGCLAMLVVLLVACGAGGYFLVVQPIARAQKAQTNMKLIMLAVHNCENQNRELPSGLILPRGSAIGPNTVVHQFSWRVQLLPFMEQRELYEKFDFNQPWDSEHNLKVAAEMPDVYRSPNEPAKTNHTSYLAIAGKDGAFPEGGQEGRRGIADTTDGAGNTVAVVEVQKSGIVWTDPRDLTVEEFAQLMEQGQIASGSELSGTHTWVGMLDGSVRLLPKGLSAAAAKALGTRNGGDNAQLP
jgi:hypothetical protein